MIEAHIIQIFIVGLVVTYIALAYRWSRKHPYPEPCAKCHGTKRVPDERGHFKVCMECYHEEEMW